MSSIQITRADDRFRTSVGWLDSRHSFSFGPHYDPSNVGFGLLLVSNDDVVAPGTGFETHPHRDMEIVTWVLDGSLVHQDSQGHTGLIHPGLAQRMSAGRGILHSEKNDARARGLARLGPSDEVLPDEVPVRFVQMWVIPDERGVAPSYEQLDISADVGRGGLVVVASGLPRHANDRAIRIHQRDAGLLVARLDTGQSVSLPAARYVHVYVATGAVEVEGVGRLESGDALRIAASEGQRVTAAPGADGGRTEILVWEMHSSIQL